MNVIWNPDPGGNVEHVRDHDVTLEEVEFVLEHPDSIDESDSSGQPCIFGYTEYGRYILVVYERLANDLIYPVTAFDVPEPDWDQLI